jgi:hypothetical protein
MAIIQHRGPKARSSLFRKKFIESEADKREALRLMNEKHAVVRDGGKTLVMSEDYEPEMESVRLTKNTFKDISLFYHQKVKERHPKTKEFDFISLGDWWLQHPERRQYEQGIVFAPGKGEIPGYYNRWKGFAVEPKEGEWSKYRDHILDNICGGDVVVYNYVMAWLAHGIQKPWEKPETALVLRSQEKGTGKSIFTKFYRRLFGVHGVEISNSEHMAGRFNSFLDQACVLVLSEAFWAGNHSQESTLKALITDDTIAIERKSVDIAHKRSCTRVLMSSNAEWIVPAGTDERRFCVLDVSSARKQDTEYFGAIVDQMENGGLPAMLYDLQRWDISSVDLRVPPVTAALLDQKLQSLDPTDRWIYNRLCEGSLIHTDSTWSEEIIKTELYESYCSQSVSVGSRRRLNQVEFAKRMRKTFPALDEVQRHGRPRAWLFPDIEDCRTCFDEKMGSPCEWPDYVEEEEEKSALPMVVSASQVIRERKEKEEKAKQKREEKKVTYTLGDWRKVMKR